MPLKKHLFKIIKINFRRCNEPYYTLKADLHFASSSHSPALSEEALGEDGRRESSAIKVGNTLLVNVQSKLLLSLNRPNARNLDPRFHGDDPGFCVQLAIDTIRRKFSFAQ